MFCSKCGADLPDDSQFCHKCGASLTAPVPATGGAAAAVTPARVPLGQTRRKVGVWILLPLFAVVVFWAVWQINEHGYYGAAAHPAGESHPAPQPQLHTRTSGDAALAVKAGGVSEHKFAVPPGAFNVNLKGRFSATGGSGNDIEVYVLNEDNYVNWENRHAASPLYRSGKVKQDSMNVPLPPDAGTYYVVFDNKFSLLSPEAVQANLTVTYYTPSLGLRTQP